MPAGAVQPAPILERKESMQRNLAHAQNLVLLTMLCLAVLLTPVTLASASPMPAPIQRPVRAEVLQQSFDCSAVTQIPQAECEALVALYNSTQGWNWYSRFGWLDNYQPCG
jgi:hypothetical protein